MELAADGIVLRSWREDAIPAIHAACQDPEIPRWIPLIPRPYELEHARAFVADELGLGPYQLAIVEDGRVVGSIGLHVDEPSASGHIGYWCVRDARGRGVVTRALRRLCRFAFDELGLARLELIADPDNRASQRVAEKAGFQREAVLRSHLLHPDGRRRDSVMFSLLPDELSPPAAPPP
jgi:RimJ/RimL family protein N-acetyltransferase